MSEHNYSETGDCTEIFRYLKNLIFERYFQASGKNSFFDFKLNSNCKFPVFYRFDKLKHINLIY